MSLAVTMLRPALRGPATLRLAATPSCCRTLTSSRWLLSPQPSLRLHEELQRSFELHGRDGHPALSSPSLPASAKADQADASPNPATTEWRRSRPHEDWVLSHPVYTQEELDSIQIVERPPEGTSDKIARWLVKTSRAGFDFVTGYRHADPEAAREAARKAGKENLSVAELQKEGFLMTEKQWMARILFLESIAGVPGFTAAMLRHLHSLRLMRRDGGWIRTLLEEAENERMHLLTFMKIRQPGRFFRLMVLAAQGVFVNAFFLTYLVAPKVCHRFVGYLEEEGKLRAVLGSVKTYTHVIQAIERGEIPEWGPDGIRKVPQVARDFWRLPEDAKMIDLIRVVRADEAGHRFVNHTLAGLKKDDYNPVAMIHQSARQQGQLPGFTREESLEWSKRVQEQMTGKAIGDETKELPQPKQP
ncbi:hypothetical protein BMF94_2454 [Rhodotorula taiwanensis]|uniref:Alternative oxidase n=1 Tax=Rhodotorula taiwanensis TaxID=741276 RepID=A0A2S5BCE5_9BASI|nr:hypothetical protein BMF94_2454 [Rhodotorula taiwanensis]